MLIVGLLARANDGAYYVSGNHLIPMIETRISVKKEILSIKRLPSGLIEVNVYYEFFNPDEARTIDVGFEANFPYGDANVTSANGQHPYMYDFTVEMNNSILPYKVAIVNDSNYYKNGVILNISDKKVQEALEMDGQPNFKYAYYFNAKFQKGLNIVKHSYLFKASESVEVFYDFYYILTAAKRWSNKQIDDFTLLIDMGEFQDYNIEQSFFNKLADWKLIGKGRYAIANQDTNHYENKKAIRCYIQNGSMCFQKLNFKPNKELFIYSPRNFLMNTGETFNYKTIELNFNLQEYYSSGIDELSLKILKNLPYARRGYVFKTAELQQYFEKLEWYKPNPSYVPNLALLTEAEQNWLKTLK